MEIISSKENETIKSIQKLNRSSKDRFELGQFAIEGIKLAEEALKSQMKIEVCLVTSSFLAQYQAFVDQLASRAKRLCLIDTKLETKISINPSPQGLYCICQLPNFITPNHNIHAGKHLALIQIQDPGNLGTIIRTAEAFSLDCLYISADSVDLFAPKVIRASMGSCFRQKIVILDDVYAFLKECSNTKTTTYAAVLSEKSQNISQVKFSENSVIFIGNEGNGLPTELTKNIEHHIKIPIAAHVDSLSVAVASGIAAYHLTKKEKV
ncbi:MAG: RNA methyltransferase [Oscillospiraceae bacterium]|nr:RNA methyltransferase [Oscillospiraceae bacterium]